VQEITSTIGAGFLFIFKAQKFAHSDYVTVSATQRKDKPDVEVIS
jgi:hypothetical protein